MIARWLALFAVSLLWAVIPPALADSWVLPARESYLSHDGQTRLIVIPRELEDQLAYFDDKVAGKEPAGQASGETRSSAHAVLERRSGDGGWVRVWEAPLVNEVAPVRALVANGGQYVVTFDNWHSVGFGSDVVVIYGADGRHVRSFSLSDLLPVSYIRALPRTVSSLWWGGEHRLSPDGRQLILAVIVPAEDMPPDAPQTVEIAIDLATAAPVPPSGSAWDRALGQAREVSRARKQAEAAWRAAFAAPLTAPQAADEQAWAGYLRDAFSRLDSGSDTFPRAFVLRAPGATGYGESEARLRDALKGTDLEAGEARVLLLASLAPPDPFVQVVRKGVAGVRPGALAGTRIYFAISAGWRDQVAAILAPTGATFIHLDPVVPIPQNPERLARLRAIEAAEAAEEAQDAVQQP